MIKHRLHRDGVMQGAKLLGGALLLAAALVAGACSGLVTDTPITGNIAVQVSGRQGQPIPDVRIIVYTGTRHYGYATTDATGRAVVRELPRATYGMFAVLEDPVRGLNWITPGADPGNGVVPIAIDGGDTQDVNLTLLRVGPGTSEVIVEDDEGHRLPDIPVIFYQSTGPLGILVTDDTGAVRATDIPFGIFGVAVKVPEAIGGPGAPDVYVEGMFMDAGHVDRQTLVLPRCRGTIAVTVRDETDATVADYPVFAFTGQRALVPVRTNASGVATIPDLLCASYGVALRAEPGFEIDDVEGQAYVTSGLNVTRNTTRAATLRVRRLP